MTATLATSLTSASGGTALNSADVAFVRRGNVSLNLCDRRQVRGSALLPALVHAQGGNGYTQSNLVSDGTVKSQQTPAGLTFQFAPSSITPTSGSPVSSMLTLSSASYTPPPPSPYSARSQGGSIKRILTASAIFPLGLSGLLPI